MGLGGLFNRSKKKDTEAKPEPKWQSNPLFPGGNTEQSNPLYAGAQTSSSTQSQSLMDTIPAAPVASSKIKIIGLKQTLAASPKGGIGNTDSEKYNELMRLLNNITGCIVSHVFTRDKNHNLSNLQMMQYFYEQLKKACFTYLDRMALTSAGKARRAIVKQIEEQVDKDLSWIQSNISVVGFAKEGTTWESLLTEARSIKISVDSMANLRTVGGAASVNYMIPQSGGGVSFFKKEENFVQRGGEETVNTNASLYVSEAREFIINKFRLRQPDKQNLLSMFMNLDEYGSYIVNKVRQNLPAEMNEIRTAFLEKMTAYQTTDEVFHSMGYGTMGGTSRGDVINITNRNVAMSRMASLLGLDSLIAKSEIVDIVDSTTGQVHRGNLMEGAKGKNIDDLQEEAEEARKRGGNTPLSQKVAPDQLASAFSNSISGSLMKELTSLQVLDVICGQVDRHMGNVMFQQDAHGKLAHITGIDNDASFGFNEDVATKRLVERKDKRVYQISPDKSSAELVLPRMDKQLADRVLALTPQAIKLMLTGLLKKEEIDASIKRLIYMQQAIRKALTDKPETFVDNDSGWDMHAHEAMVSQSNHRQLDELLQLKTQYIAAKEEHNEALKSGNTAAQVAAAEAKLRAIKNDYNWKKKIVLDEISKVNPNTNYYTVLLHYFIQDRDDL